MHIAANIYMYIYTVFKELRTSITITERTVGWRWASQSIMLEMSASNFKAYSVIINSTHLNFIHSHRYKKK